MTWIRLAALIALLAFGKGGGGRAAVRAAPWSFEVNPGCLLCGMPWHYHQPDEQYDDHDQIGRCIAVSNRKRCWLLTKRGDRTCWVHRSQREYEGWKAAMIGADLWES